MRTYMEKQETDFATFMRGMGRLWDHPKPLSNMPWTTSPFFLQLFMKYKDWPSAARRNTLVPHTEAGEPGVMSDSEDDNGASADNNDNADDGRGGGGGGGAARAKSRKRRRNRKTEE